MYRYLVIFKEGLQFTLSLLIKTIFNYQYTIEIPEPNSKCVFVLCLINSMSLLTGNGYFYFYNLIFIPETYTLLTKMNMHISKTSKQIYGIQHYIHLNVIAEIFFTKFMLSLS